MKKNLLRGGAKSLINDRSVSGHTMKSDSPEMMSKRRQLIKLFSPAVMAFLLFSLGAVTFLVVQEAVPLDSSERVRVQRRSVARDCRMLQNTSKEKDEGIGPSLIVCGWRTRPGQAGCMGSPLELHSR